MSSHQHTNRLVHEKSPYLLQHAHNPVDWYPWGEEAFAKARTDNKPIFLSVGYSTCHWCHVMERESFEVDTIAEILNKHFVSIKVDREERPDVDRVYMTFVTSSTGHGGWPMSVFLTPQLEPFYGGTYFPPATQRGMIGFPDLLNRIHKMWASDKDRLVAQAESVAEALRTASQPGINEGVSPGDFINEDLMRKGVTIFERQFDSEYGGFGDAPKFPRPVEINFLNRMYARFKNSQPTTAGQIQYMVSFTLEKMAQGGMYDHLGGGFHRYSVDEWWHVPHFEKMLYDQGQLVNAYLDAYQISHDEDYARIVKEVLQYIQRDMTNDKGGFYSAEDADSAATHDSNERHEGLFYIWSAKEIEQVLDAGETRDHPQPSVLFKLAYGVEPNGNVRRKSDPRGEFTGKNVLTRRKSDEELHKMFDISEEEIQQRLDKYKSQLYDARQSKPRPHLDDKIITAWNGLMISGFARAHSILGGAESSYLHSAERAAMFIKQQLYTPNTGRLLRSFREVPSDVSAFTADYAYLIQGLLDIYEASGKIEWLQWARELQDKQIELFWDDTDGSFYDSEHNASIIARIKEHYDGAEPSANSISALNLQRLGTLLDITGYLAMVEKILVCVGEMISRAPNAVPQLLCAADQWLSPPAKVVLSGEFSRDDTQEMLAAINAEFVPRKVIALAGSSEARELLGRSEDSVIKSVVPPEDKCHAYVCVNYTCKQPTTDVNELRNQIMEL